MSRRALLLIGLIVAVALLFLELRKTSGTGAVGESLADGSAPTQHNASASEIDQLRASEHAMSTTVRGTLEAAAMTPPSVQASNTDSSSSSQRHATADASKSPGTDWRVDPRAERARELLRPLNMARSYGELMLAIDALPLRDRNAIKQHIQPAVSSWCSNARSNFFDRPQFMREAPLRYAAIRELRAFCVDAPHGNVAIWQEGQSEPIIMPLGSALLNAIAVGMMGNNAFTRNPDPQAADSGRAENLFELSMALMIRYRSRMSRAPEELGCERNCSGSFWPASMILTCAQLGGCPYRSALVLGICSTSFLGEGCRVGADYATAIRDRYPFAEWRRIEWAIARVLEEFAQ
jgi:hypothetical protein